MISEHAMGYFQNTGFFLALIVFSALATRLCRDHLRIMDVANHRSSHEGAVPRSGGIAILLTLCLGILAYYAFHHSYFVEQETFWGLFVSAVMISAVSFYDDVTSKGFRFKVASQLVGVAILIAFQLTINELTIPYYGKVWLGWLSYPLTVLWVVGITNAFNFMDGLNGMAAGTAAIVAICFSLITFSLGSKFVFHVSYILAAGCIGFLIFNFPRASIFMGDVGSTLLGFMFGSLAILAADYDKSHTPFMVIPILLANFILETLFTFFRRLLSGEPVHKPHRTHPYQLLNRMGIPGYRVTIIYCLQSFWLAIACVFYLRAQHQATNIAILSLILAVYLVYFTMVSHLARKRGLLGNR